MKFSAVLVSDLNRVVRFEVTCLYSVLVIRESRNKFRERRRRFHFDQLYQDAEIVGQMIGIVVKFAQALAAIYDEIVFDFYAIFRGLNFIGDDGYAVMKEREKLVT